jgi:excisionase family DNA binding protein
MDTFAVRSRDHVDALCHQEERHLSMTVAEAADVLGVSTQTIYNYIYAGKLRARRPADRYILRERDVAALASKREDRR